MSFHTQLMATLGVLQYIDLGWHGNEDGEGGAQYRWNVEQQWLEVQQHYVWGRSKWHAHVVEFLNTNDSFDLNDWCEDDGPYQKWAVACAARDDGVTLLQPTHR